MPFTATGSCGWQARSNASWITLTSAASGYGSGTLTFTVSRNGQKVSRTGTITVGNQTLTVYQASRRGY